METQSNASVSLFKHYDTGLMLQAQRLASLSKLLTVFNSQQFLAIYGDSVAGPYPPFLNELALVLLYR
jgi:hypothetical protein